jgi:hypothetical protein
MLRWSFVHTPRHGLALVEGIAGTGVVLDVGHVWWEHGLDVLVRENVAEIVSVQVTNVDAAALEEMRYERAPIGAGDVPVASLVGLLESSGCRGWYENETLARIPRERRLECHSERTLERSGEHAAGETIGAVARDAHRPRTGLLFRRPPSAMSARVRAGGDRARMNFAGLVGLARSALTTALRGGRRALDRWSSREPVCAPVRASPARGGRPPSGASRAP